MRPARLAVGGFLGPPAFVAAWAIGGIVAPDYSLVDDAISELAAVGASTRVLMTAGFVAYGIGVCCYAAALRAAQPGPAWIAAAVSAVATVGVAATPLDWSDAVDTVHGVFAGTGYVALALIPFLSLPYLPSRTWKITALATGTVASVCLVATLFGDAHGLFQRAGLTAGDVWIVASALRLVRDERR